MKSVWRRMWCFPHSHMWPNFLSTFSKAQVAVMPYKDTWIILFCTARESQCGSRDCLPSALPLSFFGIPSCFPINWEDFYIKVGGWYDRPQWHPYGNSFFPPFCPQSELPYHPASTGHLQTEAQTRGGMLCGEYCQVPHSWIPLTRSKLLKSSTTTHGRNAGGDRL